MGGVKEQPELGGYPDWGQKTPAEGGAWVEGDTPVEDAAPVDGIAPVETAVPVEGTRGSGAPSVRRRAMAVKRSYSMEIGNFLFQRFARWGWTKG